MEKRQRRESRPSNRPQEKPQEELDQRIVDVARVAKVIQGGRRFAFRALIVVGNNNGKVGVGTGKARGVQDAIRKATERARNNMKDITLSGGTIPHEVTYKYGGARVLLKPASPGTGIIAGGGVRAVLEAAGVKDVLTKSLGSSSKLNATMATFNGLLSLKKVEEEAQRRGKPVEHLKPFWERGKRNGSEQ
ncbi:MAG: 30S ribosomal protein S5 [Anaerolineae bacterium]|nr:30S ribosomal protein S5 [Thermoflexales bacterium]MDW8408454.1 30S ribosomal protein S5 [Anaerolineae bacterium]